MDDNYFLCDRVCTQSKKIKEDIQVAFDQENVGWKMVYNFLGIDEKKYREIYFHSIRISEQYI